MADEPAPACSERRCFLCGTLLEGRDRDRDTCSLCRSPRGKIADLDIAIRASGDSPDRIPEWPAIRHRLRARFGSNLSSSELWERFKDLMDSGSIDPELYLKAPVATLPDWVDLALLTSRSKPFTPEINEAGEIRMPASLEIDHGFLLDQIHLGGGNLFPISTFDAKIINGDSPTVCPKTDWPVGDEWLPTILGVYKRVGMVRDGQTIHWVGGQQRLETVCTCFGVPGSSDHMATSQPSVPRGRVVSREVHEQRKVITERWETFKRDYRSLGYSRGSIEFFASWAVEHFDDMPSDDPVKLKNFIEAYRKTPDPQLPD